MLAIGAASCVVLAQERQAEHAAVADPYAAYIHEASQQFGMPVAWIRAVLRAESAGDPGAISSAGALGLMQVMPDTWAELRVRYGLGRDPFDPRDNILAGAAYLREMFDRYGNIAAMLAAYYAGPARYGEYLSTGRALPSETRAYVAEIGPLLGGDILPGTFITAASAPPDWREAALFVVRSISTRATDAVQSGGLFVARASTGEPR